MLKNAHLFIQRELNPYLRENSRLISDVSITNVGIEITVPDESIIEELGRLGYDQKTIDEIMTIAEELGIKSSCDGVTKIVWLSGGECLIYLSRVTVGVILVGGAAALGFLLSLIPGTGWTAIGVIAGAVLVYVGGESAKAVIIYFDWVWGDVLGIWYQC